MALSTTRRTTSALAVVGALTLAGCGSDATSEPSPDAGFVYVAFHVRQDAVDRGASDAQLEAIDDAAAAQEVTVAMVTEAIHETFACFDASGVPHSDLTFSDVGGPHPEPFYSFGAIPGLSDEESLAIADTCIDKHSTFIDMLYAIQPSAIAAEDEQWARVEPLLRDCLARNGNPQSENATRDELRDAAFEVMLGAEEFHAWIQASRRGEDVEQPDTVGEDCLGDALGSA